MFNKICGWFARHYVPADHEHKLAESLFDWKYKK